MRATCWHSCAYHYLCYDLVLGFEHTQPPQTKVCSGCRYITVPKTGGGCRGRGSEIIAVRTVAQADHTTAGDGGSVHERA